MFKAVSSSWSACVEEAGTQPDPGPGFELSVWYPRNYTALPSVQLARREGGFGHASSADVRGLTAAATEAYDKCSNLDALGSKVPTVVRRITRVLGGQVSKAHQRAELAALDTVSWSSARQCLMAAGASADLAAEPMQSQAFVQQSGESNVVTPAQVAQVDTWATCTHDFYQGVAKKLATSRSALLDRYREQFVQLTSDLHRLGV